MTSTPRNALGSAEPSERSRIAAAQGLPRLLTQQSPQTRENVHTTVSSVENTPLSSVPPSPRFFVPHGSHHLSKSGTPTASPFSFHREPSRFPSSTASHFPELPSHTAKRPASLTELRSPDGGRNSQGSHHFYNSPSSQPGAQFTPVLPYHASTSPPSRAQAPPSIKSTTTAHDRKAEAGKRLPGRPRKTPVQPVELEVPTSTGVDEDRPFHNTFAVPRIHEPPYAVPSSSSRQREHKGSPFSLFENPSLVAPSPSHTAPAFNEPPIFAGPRSAYAHPLSPPRSHAAPSPWSPTEPLIPSCSSGPPYGSPGVAIPPPPYQTLPAPDSSSSWHDPSLPSVEADGYTIIRKAIPPALVREVAAFVDKGAPVIARCETAQTYVTPVQAFRVRDEFVTNWRPVLRPFFEPLGKTIPEMPTSNTVGSFRPSDPSHIRQSIFQPGHRNEVYVHIALTHLSPENGFYDFLKGSHQTRHPARTPVNDWRRTPIVLGEGDAVIWRGDVSYFLSPKGGGIWQCLAFDLGSGTIDLTPDEAGGGNANSGRQR